MKTKILFLVLLAQMFTLTASAQDVEIDGIRYSLSDEKSAAVIRKQYSGDIVIPSSVTYQGGNYTVISISNDAFYNCRNLTSVTIGNSVTSIGRCAFFYCSGLTSIKVVSDNTIYDSRDNCNAIIETSTNTLVLGCKNTSIPNSVTSIGDDAFFYCSGLTSVTIPNSVVSIGYRAFYDCSGLTSVTIPNSVTSIGESAFYHCSGLTSVTIPNSVTSIGTSAFQSCRGLTSVTIPNSVTNIGVYAFGGCSGLTSVIIPNSVTSIGRSAFSGCSGLTSVTISNSVTSIEGSTFSGCSGLTSVTIPNSVTSISDQAFSNCSSLTSIDIANSVTSIGYLAFEGCSGLTSVTIPNSVTSIEWGSFSGCSGLTSVTISNSVTSIEGSTFSGCSGLTSVTIPNSVKFIGSNVFKDCNGLTSMTIPNSVTSIDNGAFSGCSSMNSVTIEDGTKTLNFKTSSSSTPFSGCPLETLYLGRNVEYVTSEYSPSEYSPFRGKKELTSLTIGNSITSIAHSAFEGCSGLTSVTIPNSVKFIGYNAFSDCSSLNSVTIEDGTETLNFRTSSSSTPFSGCPLETLYLGRNIEYETSEYSPFSRHERLTSLTIGNSVTSIGPSAFAGCNNLTSLSIGNNVNFIDETAFSNCNNLEKIEFHSKAIGSWFSGSSSIKEIVIGDEVKTIDAGAFNGYSSLTSLTIPYNVQSIGCKSFNDCISLTSVTIGKGVTSIDWGAFYGCSNLISVTVNNEIPVEIETDVFYGREKMTLYVPKGCKTIYKAAPIWSRFKEIVELVMEYKLTYLVDGETYKTYELKYEEDITPEEEPTKEGYTFSGWSKIPEKMPADDVTITGTFTINKYKLIYLVDGETYKIYEVEYGANITAEEEPTKEGYTFSGWSKIPEKMPADDVTITGTFMNSKVAYVDLGLPSGLRWATCNVGADSPEQFGFYYDWDKNPVQESWDNMWRTPTKAERDELVKYCTYSVETINGIKGAQYTGVNGQKIFFPFAGYYQKGEGPYKVGVGGQYWTVTKYDGRRHWVLGTNYSTQADNEGYYWPLEYFSFPVRPVTSGTFTDPVFISSYPMNKETTKHVYSIDGRPLNKPQKGVNIIRYSNGQTKKVFVK